MKAINPNEIKDNFIELIGILIKSQLLYQLS